MTPTIKLNYIKATLYTSGKKNVQLKATVKGTNSKVKWSSSNKKIAAVDKKGKVTAGKSGTATVTAECNGAKAVCKITVKGNGSWSRVE